MLTSIVEQQCFKIYTIYSFCIEYQHKGELACAPGRWRSRRRRCCRSWWRLCGGWCCPCGTACSTGSSWCTGPTPRRRRCHWLAARGSGPAPVGAGRPPCPGSRCVRLPAVQARRCRTWCHCPRAGSRWTAARRPPLASSKAAAEAYLQSCGTETRRDTGLAASWGTNSRNSRQNLLPLIIPTTVIKAQ